MRLLLILSFLGIATPGPFLCSSGDLSSLPVGVHARDEMNDHNSFPRDALRFPRETETQFHSLLVITGFAANKPYYVRRNISCEKRTIPFSFSSF